MFNASKHCNGLMDAMDAGLEIAPDMVVEAGNNGKTLHDVLLMAHHSWPTKYLRGLVAAYAKLPASQADLLLEGIGICVSGVLKRDAVVHSMFYSTAAGVSRADNDAAIMTPTKTVDAVLLFTSGGTGHEHEWFLSESILRRMGFDKELAAAAQEIMGPEGRTEGPLAWGQNILIALNRRNRAS